MATAYQAWDRLNRIWKIFENFGERTSHLSPSPELFLKIEELQSRVADYQRRAALSFNPLQEVVQVRLAERRSELGREKNEKLRILNQQLQQVGNQPELRRNLQSQIAALNAEFQKKDQDTTNQTSREVLETENEELTLIEEQARQLLIELKELENELKTETISQQAIANFRANSELFLKAYTEHRESAQSAFIVLSTLALASIFVLMFIFFFYPTLQGPHTAEKADWQDAKFVAMMVSTIVGKVTIIALILWGMRFLAKLHRSFMQQSVMYYDRNSALGLAQDLVNLSNAEQKRELMKVLATGYLDFDKSAFSTTSANQAEDDSLLLSPKDIKQYVESVTPLLESAKSIIKVEK